jgi:inosine-uridine nucleoside N-ribohydrolase
MRIRLLLVLLTVLASAAAGAPRPIIVDSDGDADYDDVVGVMTAAVSPELDLRGVVVTGDEGARRARAVAKALAIVGRDDVGVYLGEPPGSPPPDFPYMAQFPSRRYGMRPQLERWAEGLPWTPPAVSGVEFYRQQIRAAPSPMSVVVTGPLSTLARAMQVADEHGEGVTFRAGIREILFSGGDFGTAEWNVYTDVGAAQRIFAGGVPIRQFGGEGTGKAYLAYDDRERLWKAETPLTWALQDLYRLYRAGWDPTSPFVPILYDVRPAAFLVVGETIATFEPAHVEVDGVGHLRRADGPPNAAVRVVDHGDRLVAFVVERLGDRIRPAVNHLRSVERLASPIAAQAAVDAAALGRRVTGGSPTDPALASALDGIASELRAAGPAAAPALEHLDLARRFLVGDPRPDAWRDPYTPEHIARVMPLYRALGVALDRRVVVLELLALGTVAVLWLVRRRARAGAVALEHGRAPADR